ncbi:MAG: conserved membrane protein of unknown function [Promethearchaeota archaeon]|nr:MAG: conserved membrane protein of unknown function [Candidatus Lokiarchaeota archaeon]
MPIRIRWLSKDRLGIALMFLGACGLFQVLFIFIAQYLAKVGNYLVLIVIPMGVTLALFFSAIIIYESFIQIKRREKLRSPYKKADTIEKKLIKFLSFPIVRPILIIIGVFTAFYLISFFVSLAFFPNLIAFVLAENIAAVSALLIANYIETRYAKIRKY